MFCKQGLFAMKRSLVCNEKKPCLQSKEALFAIKRSLVCDAKKPCLQTTDIHMIGKAKKWNWRGKRHERREASR